LRHDGLFAMSAPALRDALERYIAAERCRQQSCATTGTPPRPLLILFSDCRNLRESMGSGFMWMPLWQVGDESFRSAGVMWDGVEGADSLVVNAHKWLGGRLIVRSITFATLNICCA